MLDIGAGKCGHARMIAERMALPDYDHPVSPLTIRPMLPTDVPVATEALSLDGWGDRSSWVHFTTTQPACHALVAEVDGRLVGTGIGTANGPVGWIGTIWVEPAQRGAGIGRALTDSVVGKLDAVGCRTLLLVATEMGLPLYERMGFVQQARYHILEAAGLDDEGPADPDVDALAVGDLAAICELDRIATGEDRAHAIERFATPVSTRVLRVDGAVRAFVIRAPWGGGATIAPDLSAAKRILDARRRASGADGRVRVGVLKADGIDERAYAALGLKPIWSGPRMIRGEPLTWQPDWIWGQFNHAMG